MPSAVHNGLSLQMTEAVTLVTTSVPTTQGHKVNAAEEQIIVPTYTGACPHLWAFAAARGMRMDGTPMEDVMPVENLMLDTTRRMESAALMECVMARAGVPIIQQHLALHPRLEDLPSAQPLTPPANLQPSLLSSPLPLQSPTALQNLLLPRVLLL